MIDSQEEILWRLRALCGLKNTIGSVIVTIGGASAWSQPTDVILDLVKEKYKLNIQEVIDKKKKNGISGTYCSAIIAAPISSA